MKRIAALLVLISLACPAFAAQELDGSAWLLRGPGLFSHSDKVTFWRGHFVRQSRIKAGGQCTTYDSHQENGQVLWTAREPMANGVGEWRGVWDERAAVMIVTYSGPGPDGNTHVKAWRARRYADSRHAS